MNRWYRTAEVAIPVFFTDAALYLSPAGIHALLRKQKQAGDFRPQPTLFSALQTRDEDLLNLDSSASFFEFLLDFVCFSLRYAFLNI